jgi:tetratricopeptide (TPR) repeat protein
MAIMQRTEMRLQGPINIARNYTLQRSELAGTEPHAAADRGSICLKYSPPRNPMFRTRSIPLVTALLASTLCVDAHAATEPSPWLEVHSTHFTVITDAGDKKGREVALRFEQMRAVFATLLTKDRLNQPIPLTILAFKNDKTFYQLAPLLHVEGNAQGQGVAGQPIDVPAFFLHGEDQDFIALNLFEPEPWRAVAHDFAHMLLNDNYPPAQGWFDEGLAEYFSSIRVDDKQVEIGGDPELAPSVNQDLLGNQRDTHPPKSLTELLGAEVWISLPDLFTMKHDTLSYREGTHHTLYYAESWMVMHYLLHEKKLPETGAYFNLVLNQHVPVEDAIHQAYGMTSAQLEQTVKDYFHGQPGLLTAVDSARLKSGDQDHPVNAATPDQPYHFPALVGPEDSAITSKAMPEADARALYAGVQIRIPDRREVGLKALQALATAPTPADVKAEAKAEEAEKRSDDAQLPNSAVGNEIAHRFLSWDHIERGEFEEALSELGSAAALNPRDMWVRYYVSAIKYRMAQARHGDIQGLANMMLDLRSVLEWYPELADAYDLLALARNEGGGPAAAMQAERSAMLLSPRDERYVYHLALIYIAGKKWEAAEAQLERLKTSSDPKIATLARDRLEQLASERKYGIAGATAQQPKLAPQKTPFDVLEEDAAKRAAAEQTAQVSGPKDMRPTKFVKGNLVDIDCSQAPAAILTVAAAGREMKLRAADYKSLLLIGADNFSCEWRDRQITVNYKPGGTADGDLVSLEVR